MYSGFIFSRLSVLKTAAALTAAVLTSIIIFCAPLQVSAGGTVSRPTVEAVNLREHDWIYSIYTTKDKERYASVMRYDGEETDLEIPSELGGVKVKEISREAFCGNTYLTSVTMSEGMEKIGRYAFRGCIGLSSVTFPSTLTAVGDGAFYGCRSLTAAQLPEGIVRIGSFAFYNCRHLKTAIFPSSLRSIGSSAFQNCSMLETTGFDSGLSLIGDRAFAGCSSVKSVELTGVSSLGSGAFINCTSLKKAVLGDGITELCSDTFRGCGELTDVDSGSALASIGASAFEGCVSLKSFPGSESLKEIGPLAFLGCVALKKVEMASGTDVIGSGAFSGCTSLSVISVPEDNSSFRSAGGCLYTSDGRTLLFCPQGKKGVLRLSDTAETIEKFAAAGCRSLSGVIMDNGLKEIGGGAFLSCPDITELSIPESVETVGKAAFGMYLYQDSAKKEDYLRVFSSEDSAAQTFCTERELSFTPYAATLLTNSERVVIPMGEQFVLSYRFVSGKKASVSWESSDTSVVTVKDGLLRPAAPGSAEITLSAEGFDSCTVRVVVTEKADGKPDKEKSHEERLIYCGDTEELNSVLGQLIDPIFSANRFWFTSDPSVAAVDDDGRVTAYRRGTAVITCRMPDGNENIFDVTVTEKPSELTLIPPEDELVTGDSIRLERIVYPSGSSGTVTWKSDDESVATVDADGSVTAVGQGNCTVSAVTRDGLKSSADIRCVIPAESLSLDIEARDVYQGKEFSLAATVTPDNARQKIRWRSSDPTVASVNSKGKVTGRSFGSAVIYAETSGGLSAECAVNVIVRAEELRLDVKKLKLNAGTSYKLNAIILPSYSPETTDKCIWHSTNEKVAQVDENGVVTAVGTGNCIINCRTGGNLISKCQVQVRLPAESVSVTCDKNTVYIGETISLKADQSPEDTTDSLEWTVDNPEVARVTSGGTVRGISMGTAVVTAKLANDVTGESVSDSFEITVLQKAETVRLNKSSLSMPVGEKSFLSYIIGPDDCNDTVIWYSTDESVASVREDGLITAEAEGTCQICIETGSGVRDVCNVTIG